jgi:uncharacterized protein involved in exopolysaccharide biosynthesis
VVKELLLVFFRWKNDIATVFGLIVLFSFVFALSTPPAFESSAIILLVPGRDKKPFLPDQFTANTPSFIQVSAEDITSEIKILTSYPVLKSVVERLGLDREGVPAQRGVFSQAIATLNEGGIGFLEALGLKARVPVEEKTINRLRNHLFVNFVTRANVITVRYRDASPEEATRKVNTIIEAYIAHHLKVFSNSGAAAAIKFMGDEYNLKLTRIEDSLKSFKTMYNIIDAESEYQDIQKRLMEAKSKLMVIKRLDPGRITASDLANVSDDPAFSQLQTKLTEAELSYIELSSRYGKDEGKVIAAADEIKEIKKFVGQRISVSMENWERLMRRYQERFSELERHKVVINRFEREITALKSAYELSTQKSNEVLINSVMDNASVTSVRVIEYGHDSLAPVYPRKLRIIAFSFLIGVIIAVAYGFLRNAVSPRLFTVSEVEELTRKTVIASVPDFLDLADGNMFAAASRMLIPVVNIIDSAPVPCVALFIAPSIGTGASFITTSVASVVAGRPSSKVLRVDICSDTCLPIRGARKLSIGGKLTPELIEEKIFTLHQIKADVLEVGLPASMLPEKQDLDAFFTALRDFGYSHIFLDMSMHCADPLYLSFAKYASHIFPVVAYNGTKRFALLRLIDTLLHYGYAVSGCVFNRRRNEIPDPVYQWL